MTFRSMSSSDRSSPQSVRSIAGSEDGRLAAPAGTGIAEIDADGIILRVNAPLRAYLQRPTEGLVGESIFDFTHPADFSEEREQLRRQATGAIDGYTLEARVGPSDGMCRWVRITSTSVRNAERRFLYAVRVQQDITEGKCFEDNLATYSGDQEVLHILSAGLQRAASPEDVYSAAMDAMARSHRCTRAAVLLLDRQGKMRFAMGRGLSTAFMTAVEGHSPWSAETRDAQPLCVGDVRTSELAAELKQTVLNEGIEALAFIPLQDAGHLPGKFMVCYDQPHTFSPHEIEMATTVARHVSFGLAHFEAQRSARHLAAIVESSSDAIVSKDLNGTITSWNQGAEQLFGYTAAEVIGKPITIVIPPDRLDEEPAILARIRGGERVDHIETLRRHKSGRLIDISLTISPIRDNFGTIVGASKIARDISEQKAAQRKLQESEMRLQELMSAIPAAIYTTDARGKVTYFNDAAVEFAGRRPVLGTDTWCISSKLYWPDGRPLPHDECPMALALKEGRPIRGVEAVAERPDGTRVPFIPYPTPLHDSAGKIVGAINMLVDISERKEAETQQRLLLNELNHRVKNNMQMLQSLLSTAARRAKNTEARQHLEEASNRISAIASAQRVLYGQSGGQRFDAADLLKAVCETARQSFPRDVDVICRADRVELHNDVAMPLSLIINELLTNAVKHGSRGKESSRVEVSLTTVEGGLRLTVSDDGPGFDWPQERPTASGLKLIEGLARQLRGKLDVSRGPKARVSVVFAAGSRT